MKDLLKQAARVLLGEYSLYWVYRCGDGAPAPGGAEVKAVQGGDVRHCPDPTIAEQAGYAGDGSEAFGAWHDGALAAVCFYWHGERYRPRGFWPLGATEAKLVQIVTAPAARGRGLATALIVGSHRLMAERGWTALYARVWHSNLPSRAAFEKAGWHRVAFVAELDPLRRGRPWRLRWRVKPR